MSGSRRPGAGACGERRRDRGDTKEALAAGSDRPEYGTRSRGQSNAKARQRIAPFASRRIAGAPLYVVHVSSAMAADMISDGRKRGLPIYGETCPQYLVCDTEDYDGPISRARTT